VGGGIVWDNWLIHHWLVGVSELLRVFGVSRVRTGVWETLSEYGDSEEFTSTKMTTFVLLIKPLIRLSLFYQYSQRHYLQRKRHTYPMVS